ncbi:MAG: Sec-independent protein translocase subunit TatA [Mycobacteriales bacterium]|nr:MAG: twin-arginine translocase TatA/TatE family subunit [Pseudonocardiales bacterium]
MGEFSAWHWIIVAIVVFALFGYKKLPDATRAVGRSLRIFKSEVKGLHDDEPSKPATPVRVPPPVIENTAVQPTAAQPTAAPPVISTPTAGAPAPQPTNPPASTTPPSGA